MEKEVEAVHDRIKTLRIEKGFSILKLSTESGVSRSHLYYIESKKISPSVETLYRLAKTLGIKLKDFFEWFFLFSKLKTSRESFIKVVRFSKIQ